MGNGKSEILGFFASLRMTTRTYNSKNKQKQQQKQILRFAQGWQCCGRGMDAMPWSGDGWLTTVTECHCLVAGGGG
jgi:hypothetical protein